MLLQAVLKPGPHLGVNQVVQPRPFLGIAEDNAAQGSTVDRAVAPSHQWVPLQNLFAAVTAWVKIIGVRTDTEFSVSVTTSTLFGFNVIVVGVIVSCSVAPVFNTTLPALATASAPPPAPLARVSAPPALPSPMRSASPSSGFRTSG